MRAKVETVRIEGLSLRLHSMAPAGRLRVDDAPTVVFVHGIGMSHRSFARSQRAVAATDRTISVDLPGFGSMPAAGGQLSIEELGDLVVRAVRLRAVGELVLVGQSMGAQVVVESARRHPGAVSSIVLVGPVIAAGRRSLALQALDLARDGFVEPPRMNGVLVTDYLRSVRQYARALRPMMRYPMEHTITGVAQPVLVVRGAQDPIVPHDWATRVATAAPDGTFAELQGPHHVQERQPIAFARLVHDLRGARPVAGRP